MCSTKHTSSVSEKHSHVIIIAIIIMISLNNREPTKMQKQHIKRVFLYFYLEEENNILFTALNYVVSKL